MASPAEVPDGMVRAGTAAAATARGASFVARAVAKAAEVRVVRRPKAPSLTTEPLRLPATSGGHGPLGPWPFCVRYDLYVTV